MKKLLRYLVVLLLASAPVAVGAQVQSVSFTGTFTATGATPWLQLSGQGQCSVVLSGTATGVTIVPQVTSDTNANQGAGTAVAVTASGINAGSISYAGTAISYTGNVAAQGLSGFRINVTAISTGTVTYTERCTAAQSASVTSTPSGTQNVNVTNASLATTTTYPYNAAPQAATANSFLGVACQSAGGNSATATQTLAIACDAAGNLLLGAGTNSIGTVVTTLPYTYTATQSPKTGSFVGVGGYDTVNFQPWNVNANGVGRVTLYNTTGSLGVGVIGGFSSGQAGGNMLEVSAFCGAIGAGGNWDPCRKDPYAAGPLWTTTGGSTTASVPSNATTVVKASAGRLARILVTTLGAGTLTCYDNATTGAGTIIGNVAASAAVGTVEPLDMPAANGITCVSSATGPVATVSFY